MQPRHPLYIISKGRWDSRLTARTLDAMSVPYFVVVEAQEATAYRAALDPAYATVLVLDPAYQRAYDTCDDLGLSKSTGPGPARNFAWDHADALRASSHWVIDDNINGFYRLHRNARARVLDGSFFRAMEDFCARNRIS